MPETSTLVIPESLHLPDELAELLKTAKSVQFAGSTEELSKLAMRDAVDNWHEVRYDVPGTGSVLEARVCRVKNGIAANYVDPYMRRRDPDCTVVGDEQKTDKIRFVDRWHKPFSEMRDETFAWLKTQDLAVFVFYAGHEAKGLPTIAICPANAGFFALGLAMLQGIIPLEQIPANFKPRAAIYIAPPFRHTHFQGKQVVVHNRADGLHELFSYNLYPGPSAKKGVYGMLINLGEQEGWVTAHCSTVQVVTPYDNRVVIMHEGASGGGKSEMLEYIHREPDGRLLLGRNVVSGERRHLTLPRGCELNPVTDDMALCLSRGHDGEKKLRLSDAEAAWFVRVNHITDYGIDPHLEKLTISPPHELLFLNIDVVPESRALIWEHVEDAPGKPCPNPRVVIPRSIIPGVVNGSVTVDIRSFGVRTPPCTRNNPSFGIMGLFHVLPPALAWLWRLTAPRGHANPSIVSKGGKMESEGVGSYWPFAIGRRVDQANLLLTQIMQTTDTTFVLCPNQHVGAWEVGFMPQWVAREYLARRGPWKFRDDQITPARCPLLGYTPRQLQVEGTVVSQWFIRVESQPEVGEDGYDAGAKILYDFFREQLPQYLDENLHARGKQIIEACMDGATVADYEKLSAEMATDSAQL